MTWGGGVRPDGFGKAVASAAGLGSREVSRAELECFSAGLVNKTNWY